MCAEPPGLRILRVKSSVLALDYYELLEFKDQGAALGSPLFILQVSKITLADKEAISE